MNMDCYLGYDDVPAAAESSSFKDWVDEAITAGDGVSSD